jgi:Domain of unknown function (DUF397)
MRDLVPPSIGNLSWRVARKCNAGNCVLIGAADGKIVLGDSKYPDGPVLSYSREEWITFVDAVRQGEFDDLI